MIHLLEFWPIIDLNQNLIKVLVLEILECNSKVIGVEEQLAQVFKLEYI